MEIYKLISLLPFCDDINNIIKNIWFRTFIPLKYVPKDTIILINNHLCKVCHCSVGGTSISRNGQSYHYIGHDIFTGVKYEMLVRMRKKLVLKYS